HLVMATAQGEVKRTLLSEFASVRSSGLIAVDMRKGDEMIGAVQTKDGDNIIMVTQDGQSIHFPIDDIRLAQRASGGVIGIKLEDGDKVVSLDNAVPDLFLFVVSVEGHGKITPIAEYPMQHRAGSGVITFKTVDKTGKVVAAQVVHKEHELLIISANGIVTRTPVTEDDPTQGITIQERDTQGVRVMRLDSGDRVVGVAWI